jgi:hypothetical protein
LFVDCKKNKTGLPVARSDFPSHAHQRQGASDMRSYTSTFLLILWVSAARANDAPEKVDIANAAIKVTREPLVDAQISPYQYGQFIEYLCDLVPSMWAEKLCDGSFEGLGKYRFAFRK